jgi:thiol-disulfide isomerase/thioredoxin
MIERLLLVTLLFAAGFALYQAFKQRQIHRLVAQNAEIDPVFHDMKSGIPTILYFTTPQCIPCKTQQYPALENLLVALGDRVQIVKVDATEDPEIADRWGVLSVPTTFVPDGTFKPREVNYGVADTATLLRQITIVTQS